MLVGRDLTTCFLLVCVCVKFISCGQLSKIVTSSILLAFRTIFPVLLGVKGGSSPRIFRASLLLLRDPEPARRRPSLGVSSRGAGHHTSRQMETLTFLFRNAFRQRARWWSCLTERSGEEGSSPRNLGRPQSCRRCAITRLTTAAGEGPFTLASFHGVNSPTVTNFNLQHGTSGFSEFLKV